MSSRSDHSQQAKVKTAIVLEYILNQKAGGLIVFCTRGKGWEGENNKTDLKWTRH